MWHLAGGAAAVAAAREVTAFLGSSTIRMPAVSVPGTCLRRLGSK